MERLTQKEESVMQILWKLKKGFVKDIIDEMPEPHPPYNTISSLVRVLEKKGFIGHTAYGKTYEYHPLVSRSAYLKSTFKGLLSGYFENSYERMVSFMVKEENISDEEVQKLQEIINKNKEESS
ncbi:BlaI/MecI/CopY family transcriptional regulator [Chondrinema litorale]|uniref:BlaI/MecI/CopY family transcriptional regulator n=1 Tax=Chondrinema litorale TaxID=2994555 RepID=UPI0025436D6E|nr:BlaI/MecI/CopY family transcriptional regulator [Chondrinema litorale]UZR95211.1 BlaI/MecI/CopY family transcriptional regulator [Chondrinema litorale]